MLSSIPRKQFVPKHKRSQPPEKSGFNWMPFTTFISISIPVLYVIGRAYDLFYLDAYGLSAELFPRSTQDYLFFALIGIWEVIYSWFISLDWIYVAVWAVGGSLYMWFLWWFDDSKLKPRLREKARTMVDSQLVRILGVLSAGPIVVSVGLAICFFLLGVLAIPLAIGLTAGRHVAKAEIKRDVGVCAQKVRKELDACIVVFKDGKQLATGRLVAASTSDVAISVDGKVVVFSRDKLTLEVKH